MKHWFKTNKIGIGWFPATLEGWLVVITYLSFLLLSVWESYRPQKKGIEIIKEELPTWAFLTLLLLVVAYFKGEKLTFFKKHPK